MRPPFDSRLSHPCGIKYGPAGISHHSLGITTDRVNDKLSDKPDKAGKYHYTRKRLGSKGPGMVLHMQVVEASPPKIRDRGTEWILAIVS